MAILRGGDQREAESAALVLAAPRGPVCLATTGSFVIWQRGVGAAPLPDSNRCLSARRCHASSPSSFTSSSATDGRRCDAPKFSPAVYKRRSAACPFFFFISHRQLLLTTLPPPPPPPQNTHTPQHQHQRTHLPISLSPLSRFSLQIYRQSASLPVVAHSAADLSRSPFLLLSLPLSSFRSAAEVGIVVEDGFRVFRAQKTGLALLSGLSLHLSLSSQPGKWERFFYCGRLAFFHFSFGEGV